MTIDDSHSTRMKSPPLSNPLGSYADRDEFQVGSTLVWVLGPPDQREELVAIANLQFSEIWVCAEKAVATAVELSRSELPDFWQAHDDAGTSSRLLKVWGILIDAVADSTEYDVREDPDFKAELHCLSLPLFPSRRSYRVVRTSEGTYAARAVGASNR